MAPLHDSAQSNAQPRQLEQSHDYQLINAKFPHLAQKLEFYWGGPGFRTLMDELQQDDRGGQRTGFPANVLMAIYSLAALHDQTYPKLARKELSYWSRGNPR